MCVSATELRISGSERVFMDDGNQNRPVQMELAFHESLCCIRSGIYWGVGGGAWVIA